MWCSIVLCLRMLPLPYSSYSIYLTTSEWTGLKPKLICQNSRQHFKDIQIKLLLFFFFYTSHNMYTQFNPTSTHFRHFYWLVIIRNEGKLAMDVSPYLICQQITKGENSCGCLLEYFVNTLHIWTTRLCS